MNRVRLAERFVRARQATGFSVTQMAPLAGVPPAIVRAFEAGASDIPLGMLERLAVVLGLDSDILLADDVPIEGYGAMLRSDNGTLRADIQPDAIAHLGRVAAQVCLDRRRLDRLLARPAAPPQRPGPLPPRQPEWREGAEQAERLRDALHLGRAPIRMADLLATLDVGLVLTSFPDQQLLGLSLVDELHGPAVIANLAHRNHRFRTGLRFTIAHELFHALFDRASGRIDLRRPDDPDAYDAHERRANAFAVNLLAPAEAVKQEISQLGVASDGPAGSPATIVHLVQKFGVGIRSLVDFLASPALGLVPQNRRGELLARTAAGVDSELYHGETFELDASEPWQRIPIERRGHFSVLAIRVFETGRIDRDELRQFLGLAVPSDLDPILALFTSGAFAPST